jgi:quercetin dioxygenase-like cupin family protein
MELKDRRMDFTAVMGFVQTFLVSQEETNGRYVELEIVMKPGAGGAPLHIHPYHEERFGVKGGVVDVFHSGTWHKLKAGEVAVVPPGMPDQFKNTSDKPATLLCRVSPVLDFQDMNIAMMKLITDGKMKSQSDLKSIIYGAMVLKQFPKSVRVLSPTYRWTTSCFAFIESVWGIPLINARLTVRNVPNRCPTRR